MSYNLLNFPNGRNDCGSNLSVLSRWDTLRKIVQFQKPDILMVCELQTEAGADSILNQALNTGSINYYARANFVVNQSGFNGLNNMFFYNTNKVTLYSQSEILTDLRDVGEYVVYANDPNLSFYNDTSFIRFYVSHLKAGNSNPPIEENRRASEATSLRTYIDGISSTGNFVFGGDFNFYTSSEPGYQILTTGGVNKLNDPINSPGNWNNNSSFTGIHTQSTRSSQSIECGAPGGMDDRFDFILISDSIVNGGDRVQYISGTYAALGNDGNRFNQSLISPANTSLPDSVINALYYMSDHLPVVMDLLITYPNVMLLSIAPTEITCNGDCNGTGIATVAGGSPPYTYQWDDPGNQTTLTATGLCPGTYRFTFTDSTGLSLVDSIVLTDPPVLSASFSDSSIISCSGDSSGFATASTSGGIPGYSYLWDDSGTQTTASATGLPAGTYTVVVTDDRTCTASASITIIQVASTPLSVNISASTNILCNGNSSGAATVTTSGGTTPYTFTWDDPSSQTDSMATGLLAGTYIVAVTDSAGCPGSDAVTITQTANLVLTIIDSATASCGATDAYAAVVVSGGLGSYTYLWSDPATQTTDTATALAAGSYVVIVTDSVGCVDSAQANLVDFSGPTLTITDSTNIACFGSATGSATVSATGGSAPYTYSWSPFGGADTAANFLTAGVYTVTVIDNAPCTSVISVTITEPPVFTATLTDSLDVLCFGDSTGTATVTPVGGVQPYTYTWSNGDTDSIADSLAAGNYTVTIVDANGCNANGGTGLTKCFEIRSILVDACNPSGPESDNEMVRFEVGSSDLNTGTLFVDWPFNNWDGLCQNAATSDIIDSINANIVAGGIVVEPVGGVLPAGAQVMLITSDAFDWQSHDWSALDYTLYLLFQCDDNFNGHFKNYCTIPCGTRTLIIDFGGGCTDTVIYEPDLLTTNSGNGNGDEVEFDDAGNPTYQNIGCSPPVVLSSPPMSVTISQPGSAVVASVTSSININCFGDSTGSANADGSGGTPPYAYAWDDPSSQSDSTATGLPAGNYVTTVTDNNGCIDTAQITITQPAAALVASISGSTNIICFGASTGSATVATAGGTTSYTYSWSDPSSQTNTTATSLSAGPYFVIVTDANGCIDSASVTITEPPPFLIFSVDVVDANCGQSDGSVTASSSGGTLPHTYQWDDPSSQTDTTATGLGAGTYKVVVTDGAGCTDSLTLVLNNITGPGINVMTSIEVACNGDSTGTAAANAGGGTEPYTYLWDDFNTQTDSAATGLPAGTYNVTVTDVNGCTTTGNVSITEPIAMVLTPTITNPGCGLSDGTASISVVNGITPYTYSWNTLPTQTDTIATGLGGGTYTVVVTDAGNCSDSVSATLTASPLPVLALVDSVNVLCNGDSTGSITTSVSGGVSPYTFLWNDPSAQADSLATGLTAGTYTLVVTGSNGCVDSITVSITQPSALLVGISSTTNILCNGDSTGMINVSSSGGTSPHTYLWDDPNAQTDSTAIGLTAGTYSVLVTDSLGCTGSDNSTITQPSAIAISITTVDASCGLSDGSANASVAGGSTPYTYAWNTSPTQSDTTATGLAAGSYTFNIIDGNNCTDSAVANISNIGGPTISISDSVNITCNGDSTGSATVSANGGSPPLTYLWDDPSAQTDSIATGLLAGTFTVTVTDNLGCISITSVTLTEAAAMVLTTSSVMVMCNGGSTGAAIVSVSGGAAPYTYLWDDLNAQTNANATGLPAGTYTVIVTDSNSCSETASTVVTEPAELAVTISTTDVLCNGESTGTATAVVTGGVTPYTYSWSTIGCPPDPFHPGLDAGSVTITVTDANGCVITQGFTITEPAALTGSIVSTNVSCNGMCDGSGTITGGGGINPYTYIWNDPGCSTDSSCNSLCAGTYLITISDANSCSITDSFVVTEPMLLGISTNSTNASCGASNGSALAIGTGGTSPLSYLWDDPLAQTNAVANNLNAGNYTVTVTDSANCQANDTVIISTTASPLINSLSTMDETCSGDADGSIDMDVSGGSPPYIYNWNTNPSSSTQDLAGLNSGVYVVVVIDSAGCAVTDSAILSVIDVNCTTSLIIPTSFSPNSDGTNDTWFRDAVNYPNILIEIFNRWGSLVHSSEKDGLMWDGKYKGKDVAMGTYYFIIMLGDGTDPITGNVTIVR